ncbi:MAG: RNA methyltransferase [Candidatus Micrarchaeaceae archaeon]
MMDIRVVSVKTLYQINAGYIARICANFGVSDLRFVEPRCRLLGKTAVMYSKHGRHLLENSKVYKSVEDAVKGSIAVATTSEPHKSISAFFNLISPEELFTSLSKSGASHVSIVLGREDIGLSKEEIAKCDYTVSIDTGSAYNAMNISHFLAIILYTLSRKPDLQKEPHATESEIARLIRLFEANVAASEWVRNKAGIVQAFNRIISRSNPSSEEIAALSAAFSTNRIKKR